MITSHNLRWRPGNALLVFLSFTLIGSYCENVTAQTMVSFGNITKLPETINSDAEEIMPLVSSDGKEFYFVRANHKGNVGGIKTGHDIWLSNREGANFSNTTNKLKGLNNPGNNAVVGISKSSELYVLNAYKQETNNHQGIAKSKKNGKSWSDPEYVEIPGMNHDTEFFGYYVNPEETVMFISMHAGDAVGKEDLYISVKEGNTWSAPKNLGSKVNTTGFEMSPYLSPDGKRLYFSSDGHGGHGGADIFYCERTGDDWFSWSDPVNLGSEVNSSGFDAYFIEGPDSIAYFASNRDNFHSDLFTLKVDIIEEIVEEVITVEEPIEAPVEEPVVDEPAPKPIPTVRNIYFDINKANIKTDSRSELDEIVRIMKDEPNLEIEIMGHTDETHTAESNMALSKRRASAAKKYLVSKGIDGSRITTKGFGETQPAVDCSDCSDEQHQSNRRVEFKLFREI